MRALLGAWGVDVGLALAYLEDPGRFHDPPDEPAEAA
jgi:hypothetical protein